MATLNEFHLQHFIRSDKSILNQPFIIFKRAFKKHINKYWTNISDTSINSFIESLQFSEFYKKNKKKETLPLHYLSLAKQDDKNIVTPMIIDEPNESQSAFIQQPLSKTPEKYSLEYLKNFRFKIANYNDRKVENLLNDSVEYIIAKDFAKAKPFQKEFNVAFNNISPNDFVFFVDYIQTHSYKDLKEIIKKFNNYIDSSNQFDYLINDINLLHKNENYKELFYILSNKRTKRKTYTEKSNDEDEELSPDIIKKPKKIDNYNINLDKVIEESIPINFDLDLDVNKKENIKKLLIIIEKNVLRNTKLARDQLVDKYNFKQKNVSVYMYIFEYLLNYINYTIYEKNYHGLNNQLSCILYALNNLSKEYICIKKADQDKLLLSDSILSYKNYKLKLPLHDIKTNLSRKNTSIDEDYNELPIDIKNNIEYRNSEYIKTSLMNYHLIILYYNNVYYEDDEDDDIKNKILKFYSYLSNNKLNKFIYKNGVIEFTNTDNDRTNKTLDGVPCCYLCGYPVPIDGTDEENKDCEDQSKGYHLMESDIDHIIPAIPAFLTGIIQCPLNFAPTHKSCNRQKKTLPDSNFNIGGGPLTLSKPTINKQLNLKTQKQHNVQPLNQNLNKLYNHSTAKLQYSIKKQQPIMHQNKQEISLEPILESFKSFKISKKSTNLLHTVLTFLENKIYTIKNELIDKEIDIDIYTSKVFEIYLYTELLSFYKLINLIKEYNPDYMKGGGNDIIEIFKNYLQKGYLPKFEGKDDVKEDDKWLLNDRIEFLIARYLTLYEYTVFDNMNENDYLRMIQDNINACKSMGAR